MSDSQTDRRPGKWLVKGGLGVGTEVGGFPERLQELQEGWGGGEEGDLSWLTADPVSQTLCGAVGWREMQQSREAAVSSAATIAPCSARKSNAVLEQCKVDSCTGSEGEACGTAAVGASI